MIEWQDHGILIHLAPLGERRTLATYLTAQRGRHRGVLKTKVMGLTLGTESDLTWSSRLEDNLGTFQIELRPGGVWQAMTQRLALQAVGAMCAMAHWLTPERVPMPLAYQALRQALGDIMTAQGLVLYDLFEHTLLYELGYVATPAPSDTLRRVPPPSTTPFPVQPPFEHNNTLSHPVLDRMHNRQDLFMKVYPHLSFLHVMRQNFLDSLTCPAALGGKDQKRV